jgi:hypothetical protein
MSAEDLQAALEGGETIADLAEARGVELADVKAAADAARETATRERIEQAVEDGKLSRERADWMLEGLDEGFGPVPGGARTGKAGGPGGLDAAAEALGMSVEDMQLQLWGGRTMADLAESAGVDLETLQEAIKAAREQAMRERLAQAVEDGRMTQEQADWMIEGIDNGYGCRMGRGARGGLPGAPMGGDRPGGRMGPRGGLGGRPAPEDGAGFRMPRLGSAEPA